MENGPLFFLTIIGYGGYKLEDCVTLEGFDHALVPAWRGDNNGPAGRGGCDLFGQHYYCYPCLRLALRCILPIPQWRQLL